MKKGILACCHLFSLSGGKDTMNYQIITQNQPHVTGTLSGWDRLIFRGCLFMLTHLDGMLVFLRQMGVLLKDYSDWAKSISDAMKQACLAEAQRRNRPVIYLTSSQPRKDVIFPTENGH
jgi:hypothetical protein